MARLAWLLSVLSIATSVVHMAVIRHDRCLEHGELIELIGAPVDHQPGQSTALAVASASEQHDEHCPLANATGAPVDAAPLALMSELPTATLAQPHALAEAAHPSVDTLDVAPKQGPPDRSA